MTALFGPMANVGTAYGYSNPYGPVAGYPRTVAQHQWWSGAGQLWASRQGLPNGGPIRPAPPVRNLDTPNGVPSFGPPPAPSLVGTQYTHPDQLFGPFARLGGTALG